MARCWTTWRNRALTRVDDPQRRGLPGDGADTGEGSVSGLSPALYRARGARQKEDGSMGRRLRRGLLCLAALALLFVQRPPVHAETRTVYYFYQNYCDSCDPRAEFYGTFLDLTGESLDGYAYEAYDVDTPSGMRALEEALAPFDARAGDAGLPVVIFDGQLYMGDDQIQAGLPAYILREGGNTESFFYYLSVNACESCKAVEAMLAELPASVQVKRGTVAFDSPVRYEQVTITEDREKAMAFFDAFGVPEDRRTAPMLLAGERFYQGEKAVASFLRYSLPAGRAIGTPVIEVEGAADGLFVWILATAAVGVVVAVCAWIAVRHARAKQDKGCDSGIGQDAW
ncbi:hypothetical protein LJC74_05000 [Eubacteriales bacterium OttesenSCG-928-A19]|nr:hypothetical protein [Eubacteriales bacterium OttesenSCG-928-A19]